ncbi:HigA family addiction module antitoxin [Sphingomonas sp. RS6]
MSGSRITIADEDRLDNVHPGEILREEFLVGADLPLEEVAAGTGLDPLKLAAVVAGDAPVDADIDLRLTRYLRMSEGFFLGLQMDFDLEDARRRLNGALDRIVPRAA